MFSSSSCRFFASSFSRFLAFLIHLSVSSTSGSASPNVAPFSDALSSRLFFTLRRGYVSYCFRASECAVGGGGLDGPRGVLEVTVEYARKIVYLLCNSILDFPAKKKRELSETDSEKRYNAHFFSRSLASSSRRLA